MALAITVPLNRVRQTWTGHCGSAHEAPAVLPRSAGLKAVPPRAWRSPPGAAPPSACVPFAPASRCQEPHAGLGHCGIPSSNPRSSLTAPELGCPVPERSSSRKCAPSSGCTSTRRTTRWFCAWMRSHRFRRSMGLGYVEGYTHDYVRHGTTTLFAALDIATGRVLAQCRKRHRHEEFPGVPAVDRPGGAGGVGRPPRAGQLCDAQARQGQAVAGWRRGRVSTCTSRPPTLPG